MSHMLSVGRRLLPVVAMLAFAASAVLPVSAAARATGLAGLGPNRVSIPALGIDRVVSPFACSRSQPPGHAVYRWGCAGSNNVYLFAHASSLFKPLHDLYTSGRLRAGLRVDYADGRGNVRTYAVRYWRVVKPDGDIEWAYAAQAQPSMTLQTCLGANSEWRLVVRLVAVGPGSQARSHRSGTLRPD